MKHGTRRILADLGTLLTPTSLVAVFCGAMGVDPQRTAVYSIAAVVFVACCYYRTWISSHIPSSFVLAVTSGLGVLFFANYDNILLKDTGLIKRYHESSELQADLGAQIANARREAWFFGTNFHVSTVDRRPALLERLKSGLKVRYLILNPTVAHLNIIAADFDQQLSELREECLKGLKDTFELQRRWTIAAKTSTTPGELEVRLYDRTPSARMYSFDPGEPGGRTIFVPYMHGFNSPNLPGYLFDNSASGVAPKYISGVQKLWNESERLDAFLARHPDIFKELQARAE